jgi:hypothetical protein
VRCLLTLGARIAWTLYQFATDWKVWGSNLGGSEIFHSRLKRIWGLHKLLYNRHRVSFPRLNRSRFGVDHIHQLAPRLKKEYNYTSAHIWAFIACYGVKFCFAFTLCLLMLERTLSYQAIPFKFTPCKQLSLVAQYVQLNTINNSTVWWTVATIV